MEMDARPAAGVLHPVDYPRLHGNPRVSRKVIFVDLALAQIAALGATYATTLGYDAHEPADSLVVAVFSLLFTFAGAGLFSIAACGRNASPRKRSSVSFMPPHPQPQCLSFEVPYRR
jgi:hypothetical protein